MGSIIAPENDPGWPLINFKGVKPRGITVLDIETGRLLLAAPEVHHWSALDFGPDGQRLVACNEKDYPGTRLTQAGIIGVWDVGAARDVLTLGANERSYVGCLFSPEGAYLAGVLRNAKDLQRPGEVRIWRADTGRLLGSLASAGKPLAFSADGRHFAAAGEGGVWAWRAPWTGPGKFCKTEAKKVGCLALSPDGTLIAASAGDVVYVWDARSGEELFARSGASTANSPGGDVAFSPDGSRLVIASRGGIRGFITVCDPKTGQEFLTLPHYDFRQELPPEWEGYRSLAFSRDGDRLAVAERDANGKDVLTIWDATPLGR